MASAPKPKTAPTASDVEKKNDTIHRPKARTIKHLRPVIVGPPKHGKTHFAATFSRYYKYPVPDNEEVVLKDMLWVPFDADAIDGLLEKGITADMIDEDLPYYDGKQMEAAPSVLGKKARSWLKKRRPEVAKDLDIPEKDVDLWIVVDTLSTAAFNIEGFYTEGNADGRDMWRYVQSWHRRMFYNLNRLKANVLWLCHIKEVSYAGGAKGETAAQVKKRVQEVKEFTGLPGSFESELDIGGKSKKFFVNTTSGIWPLLAERDVTKNPSDWKRAVYPYGFKKIEGGSRFSVRLNAKEPANGLALLRKLRGENSG